MARMELRELDLNLLLVFRQLLQERRVSAVATQLGVSQPAVSNALRRLRTQLGDELFLRTSRGMEPTPFAERVAQPIAAALTAIHGSLQQQSRFDPLESTRRFTLAMTDIGEIYFLPELMRALRRAAPGISISTARNSAANLQRELEAGTVDLAIGYIPDLRAGILQRVLFPQRYVCLFRAGHALGKRKVTRKEFSAAEHVVVISEGTGHGRMNELLERSGARPKVRLRVPHFVAVGPILQATDLVASVPEKLAMRLAEPYRLRYAPHPVKLPEIQIKLFSHARHQREPDNRWLRDFIYERFAE
jgi:DNA-binding transcriptional LysR family regulator